MNQSNYKRYDLADDNSILIKISGDDKKSFEFKIGKSAQSYNHTFIKLSGNPNIYLAQEKKAIKKHLRNLSLYGKI